MDIIRFTKAEDLVYFMELNINLSRVDSKFLQNLMILVIKNNAVTTNQDALFRRIIEKYARQFAKLGYFIKDLKTLPWKHPVVQSSPVYTEAFISIEDNKLFFRAPYNKEFLKDLRKNPIHSMLWNKELRAYKADLLTESLSILVALAHKNYNTVNYCPIVKKLLDDVNVYESVRYWEPTLILHNDNLLIAAANTFVMDAINHIELNLELKTLAELVTYGIKIDSNVIKYILVTTTIPNEKIVFATSYSPTVEFNNIETVVEWLNELGCDAVLATEPINLYKNIYIDNIQTHINQYNMDLITIKSTNVQSEAEMHKVQDYNKPVAFVFRHFLETEFGKISMHLFKKIKFANSEPIRIQ